MMKACSYDLYRFMIYVARRDSQWSDSMGRILMIEFNEKDSTAFNEIMEVLKRHSDFEHLCLFVEIASG